MNVKSLATAVTSTVGKQLLTAKQHSPSLMFAAGVVGFGATVVLAARSTRRIDPILDQLDENLAKVEVASETGRFSEKQLMQTRIVAYSRATAKLGKLYGPAIIVGGISIALLTGSHITLKNRVTGLTAAYAALDKGFKLYRKRVVDELGLEKDREFRYGVDEREILIEGENGPEVIHDKVTAHDGDSIYAKFFNNETSKDWSPNPEANILFLRAQQQFANHRLNAKGYLLLNDVYKALGMKPTTAGAVVGWLKDSEGDGFVDFGCWSDADMDAFKSFYYRGQAAGVLLDFNVDGNIFRAIDKLEG